MRLRPYIIGFLLSIFMLPVAAAQSKDAHPIMQGLRSQMKQLESLRAQYIVVIEYGPARDALIKKFKETWPQYEVHAEHGGAKKVRCRIHYVRSGSRFNILETTVRADGTETEERTVYDGLHAKTYTRDDRRKVPRQGFIHPAKDTKAVSFGNDILYLAGFSLITRSNDKRFASYAFENCGTEPIDGHDCIKVLLVTPFRPGRQAYNYSWVELAEPKYILRRVQCLIDDDPTRLLYERTYEYDCADDYPFPSGICYRRFEIDDQAKRSLLYKKHVTVETVEINPPVDPCEFEFAFPEGTVVNVAPLFIDIDDEPNELEVSGLPDVGGGREPQTPPDTRTVFEFPKGQFPLMLPLRLHGREYSFMLDTGTSYTLFDLSLKPQLGQPRGFVKAKTATNPIVMPVFHPPEAFVGCFTLADCNKVGCANLRMLSPFIGKELNGVLGLDFLKSHILQIDFDAGRLSFLDANTAKDDWGHAFTLTFDSIGTPRVNGTIGDRFELDLVVDTGYGGTGSLRKDVFEELVTAENLKTSESRAATPAGVRTFRETRIQQFSVGPLSYGGLIMNEAGDNVLGLDFLSRHLVTFDFPNCKLYLKEGEDFDGVDESGMSGLSLLRFPDKTVVYTADEDAPAAKAGMRAGDIILKIQGQDANDYEMWQIRELLRSTLGRKITMTVRRGDQIKQISFVLERTI